MSESFAFAGLPTTAAFADVVATLRGVGEPTRLRILALLAQGEATVKDLTEILAQSQPRVSRHLKLLTEAGLVERMPEGAWAYYRLNDAAATAHLVRTLLDGLDSRDEVIASDRRRLASIQSAHAALAQRYFARNAASWDRLRTLHVAEDAVEAAIREIVATKPIYNLLDVGTGTGRMLTLLSDLYSRGVGVDMSHDMLSVARANLADAHVDNAHVRQGDVTALPALGGYDCVVIHQVLHYLDDPARALKEAARTLTPGGRLLVVDFAPHAHEFLRTEHAHRRLGFGHEQMRGWLEAAGLEMALVRDLPSDRPDGLTVSLFLAVDRRIELAGVPASAA